MSEQDLFYDLHASRERLCRAQVGLGDSVSHRELIQEAIDNIDRVGVFHFPKLWSRHDNPPMPGDDR